MSQGRRVRSRIRTRLYVQITRNVCHCLSRKRPILARAHAADNLISGGLKVDVHVRALSSSASAIACSHRGLNISRGKSAEDLEEA